MTEPERILLVGAGAVGQVYGRHLQRSGAAIDFYVKPHHVPELEDGVVMYPLNERPPGPVPFEGYGLVTTAEEVAQRRYDQVWLCVSTPALRGKWLSEVLGAAGEATVISLQPGLVERDLLLTHVPDSRLVTGMIAFIAWHAPLPGEEVDPPGMRYWFPPLSPSPFGGPGAEGIVARLRAGGCPATVADDVRRRGAVGSGLLLPVIAALETAGWSFAELRRGEAAAVGASAAREAVRIGAAHVGTSPGAVPLLARAWLLRLLTRLAPHLVPFDLETYLRVHFTKVGDQTRMALEELVRLGRERDLPTASLERLRGALS